MNGKKTEKNRSDLNSEIAVNSTAGDSRPLHTLKGIGPKTEELFRRAGIETRDDLLHDYPRDYDACDPPVKPGEAIPGQKNAVIGRITRKPSVRTFGSNSITIAEVSDETGSITVNWFHMPFLRNSLRIGEWYVFRGLVVEKNGRLTMEHPELLSPEKYSGMTGLLMPIYSLTAGLSNNMVRRAVAELLKEKQEEAEFLPDEIRETYGLCEINYALTQIHFPDSREACYTARNRLAFDEFFLFLLGVSQMRSAREREANHFPMKAVWKTERVISGLPYRLTPAQDRVWVEMEKDMASPHLMSRLIQGDVGSGKTILAFLGMIMAYENGFQSAMMVPTEVLAEQQFASLSKLLEENGMLEDVHPVLLRGSCTAAEKKKIREEIATGRAAMVVGTHALIQDAVTYNRLGFVVTDEQHRFGVRQRERLTEKGYTPHVLVMSATPIPRTLAMILYGDQDISLLDDMPAGRLPVKNCVVGPEYRETAYRFIEKQVAEKHQAYVICPMVEPNDELPCENVTEYTEKLKARFRGKNITVGMLHGRMKAEQKHEIMEAFSAGEIDVLVSTTVVEVGVNVPAATVMMIENAERFGLAQLHQLRGRVGRGKDQAYCIFIQGNGKKEISPRLKVLNTCNDGMQIAEEDLKLRGPGDLFGVRQSGEAIFHVADIYRDHDILEKADAAAKDLRELDPGLDLPQNSALKNRVEAQFQRQFAYSDQEF